MQAMLTDLPMRSAENPAPHGTVQTDPAAPMFLCWPPLRLWKTEAEREFSLQHTTITKEVDLS